MQSLGAQRAAHVSCTIFIFSSFILNFFPIKFLSLYVTAVNCVHFMMCSIIIVFSIIVLCLISALHYALFCCTYVCYVLIKLLTCLLFKRSNRYCVVLCKASPLGPMGKQLTPISCQCQSIHTSHHCDANDAMYYMISTDITCHTRSA